MQIILKKSLILTLAFVIVFCTAFFAVRDSAIADTSSTVNFDAANVLDDLNNSVVDGRAFDIRDYPFNESRSIQIIAFVEYCYSYRVNMQKNYGLYIYVYNPKGINIADDSQQNKVQMAVSYDSDGAPNCYEKFNLRFCSKSEQAMYKNLFYKFKVVDHELTDQTTFLDRVNSNERRYDISGIELLTYGRQNAIEYGIGGSYRFTGYSQGYGSDVFAPSSLSCIVEDLEVLKLNVSHTNYRTNVSNLGKGHYNEVNTVYFSVPERVFATYGYLQKIRAEWWEYKTKLAAVTSNREFYNQLLENTERYVGDYDSMVPYSLWYGMQYACINGGVPPFVTVKEYTTYDWSYNKHCYADSGFGWSVSVNSLNKYPIIPYAFYAPAVGLDVVFDFLHSTPVAGEVNGSVVADWIYGYTNSINGFIDCNGRALSEDLFESYVDSGRTKGYNDKTIDLEDTFDLLSYDSNHSWWDKLWTYGFSWPETDGDYYGVSPISELTSADLLGTDASVANALLVNKNDVAALRTYYTTETAKGNRVILFRFADTDYFSMPVGRTGVAEKNADTYIAQETVFMDFDIIELTFNQNGEYRAIAAVSNPVDIINGLDPPATEHEWWRTLLGFVLLFILIILFAPLLPWILKALIWIISLPFKLISAAIKNIRKNGGRS